MGQILRRLFGLSTREVTFEKRGFRQDAEPAIRARIEGIGLTFLGGYHAALEESTLAGLVRRLEGVEAVNQGFAFEGAAMSLTLLDVLLPGRARRLDAFLAGPGGAHAYMAHVGAGWAMARLPFGIGRLSRRLDPLIGWLAFDGWGFHQGYFHHRRSMAGPREVPRGVRGYARQAFDQGLGRSMWFVHAAHVVRIPAAIAEFPASRRADLWAGVGLASTYAGGIGREALEALFAAAGACQPQLAQGAAFAAEARRRAGNPTPEAELACRLYWGLSQEDAAEATLRLRPDPTEPGPDGTPAYELWRRRLQQSWEEESAAGARPVRRARA